MLASRMLYDQQGAFQLLRLSLTPTLIVGIQFWNVKVSSRRPTSLPPPGHEEGEADHQQSIEPPYVEEERKETAQSLREKQIRMEQQVYRIWT